LSTPPNNRYEVFKDIARLESCGDVADVGFMIVATDHLHYVSNEVYSPATCQTAFKRDPRSASKRDPLFR